MTAKDVKTKAEQWGWARVQYEQYGMSYQEIADKIGVTKARVGKVGKDEGWVKGASRVLVDAVVDDSSTRLTTIPALVNKIIEVSKEQHMKKSEVLDVNEDEILTFIAVGHDYEAISKHFGCSTATFVKWIDATEERASAVTRAMRQAAFLFIKQAEDALRAAKTNTEVTQARELAAHLRWKAKAYYPRVFGDKQQVELTGTIKTDVSDSDIDKRLAELSRTVDVETKLLD